jgi:hypothetical protein
VGIQNLPLEEAIEPYQISAPASCYVSRLGVMPLPSNPGMLYRAPLRPSVPDRPVLARGRVSLRSSSPQFQWLSVLAPCPHGRQSASDRETKPTKTFSSPDWRAAKHDRFYHRR